MTYVCVCVYMCVHPARTGIPMFSPRFTLEENKLKNQNRVDEFEKKFKFILENGGSDYDYEDVRTVDSPDSPDSL